MMYIPHCPRCHDCKVILAPVENLPPRRETEEAEAVYWRAESPVACSQCDWRGLLQEVIYSAV